MAPALASQLSQLRAASANHLDLKTQSKAHSQSLLFDAEVAKNQDIDTIFDFCSEGFQDLCLLDDRHALYYNDLFSDHSKRLDRSQMTKLQNEQIDVALEGFLSLVGAKLHLKPALRSVEWLIRKFRFVFSLSKWVPSPNIVFDRVHELNTILFVMTFTPYHETPIFPAVLSILPTALPPTINFLTPYAQIPACPPRHVMALALTNNKGLLAAMTRYVVNCCHLNYQHGRLLAFFTTVFSETIVMIRQHTSSSNLDAHHEGEADGCNFIMSFLNDLLSLRGAPDLRVASYLFVTVLASSYSLDDGLVKALMEAVVCDWNGSIEAGMLCLAHLAEHLRLADLPNVVLDALVKRDSLVGDLVVVRRQCSVNKLVLGAVQGIVASFRESQSARNLSMAGSLLEQQLMEEASAIKALEMVLDTAKDLAVGESNNLLTELLSHLAVSPATATLLQLIRQDPCSEPAGRALVVETGRKGLAPQKDAFVSDLNREQKYTERGLQYLKNTASQLDAISISEESFLASSPPPIFEPLREAFLHACHDEELMSQLIALPALKGGTATSKFFYCSFLVRLWCGVDEASVRKAAIYAMTVHIRSSGPGYDLQFLLPYVLYGLSDASTGVRVATADLILTMREHLTRNKYQSKALLLGQEHVYGQGEKSRHIQWLPPKGIVCLYDLVLVPGMETYTVGSDNVRDLVVNELLGKKQDEGAKISGSSSNVQDRQAIFRFLCSHAVHTPLLNVRLFLLQTLNKIRAVGRLTPMDALSPAITALTATHGRALLEACRDAHIKLEDLVEAHLDILSTDAESASILQEILEGSDGPLPSILTEKALQLIRKKWSSVWPPGVQSTLVELLLRKGLPPNGLIPTSQSTQFLETLASLSLSPMTLLALIDDLSGIASSLPSNGSNPKRRRVALSSSETHGTSHEYNVGTKIRVVTFVLELMEGCQTAGHTGLLRGLFDVLFDLQLARDQIGGSLGYMQVLTMKCVLAIIEGAPSLSSEQIDPSVIHADVLVECIRTTPSRQARNTGLLLVAALTPLAPKAMLNSVMPIFTFLGSDMLPRQDDFSRHVVKQIIGTLVPRYVQSLDRGKTSSHSRVIELLLNFVAAFEHVLEQQRMEIYTSLLENIGPTPYLHLFIAILLNKFPRGRRIVRFAVDFCKQYSIQIQLTAIRSYLSLLSDATKSKPAFATQIFRPEAGSTTDECLIHLFSFIPIVLTCQNLIDGTRYLLLDDHGVDAAWTARDLCEEILSQILKLVEACGTTRRLSSACSQSLTALLSLLPISETTRIYEKLLKHVDNDHVRELMIRSFGDRLDDASRERSAQTLCVKFLRSLVSLIEDASEGTSEGALIIATLKAMDKIIKLFGRKDPERIVKQTAAIAAPGCMRASNSSVRVATLVCLTTLIATAGEASVPLIPLAFSGAVDNMAESIASGSKNHELHNATHSCMASILLHVPWCITGPSLDRLLIASYGSANGHMGSECDQARMSTLDTMANRVGPGEAVQALTRTWACAMKEGPLAVKEYVRLIQLIVERQSKSTILRQWNILGDLFLEAFDLRRIQSSPRISSNYDDGELEESEAMISKAAIATTLKLNDAAFRPFLGRATAWVHASLSPDDHKGIFHRQMTLYTFLHALFDGLGVSAYSDVIAKMAAMLRIRYSQLSQAMLPSWLTI